MDFETAGPTPSTEADGRIQEFWQLAKGRAHVGDLDVVLGRGWDEALAPPAWAFGDSPAMADQLVELVLAGRKTATTVLKQEYDDAGEPLPHVGDLGIVLDGSGRPRALVRDAAVLILPFGDVTHAQAAAEGEGDGSLDGWRDGHRAFWARAGYEVDDTSLVVWEKLAVVFPV